MQIPRGDQGMKRAVLLLNSGNFKPEDASPSYLEQEIPREGAARALHGVISQQFGEPFFLLSWFSHERTVPRYNEDREA